MIESSETRMCTLKSYPKPLTKRDVIQMLGDQSGKKYRVFQDIGPEDVVKTIAVGMYSSYHSIVSFKNGFVGIIDCVEKTWSIYADNPRRTEPLVVLPLVFKSKSKEY